jgi:hypothetical protein
VNAVIIGAMSHNMTDASLAESIYSRLETVLRDAETQVKPLEIEPFRGQLFELFVTAHGAGYTAENSEPDLSADGVCRELSLRWGLTMAARDAVAQQSRLPADQLAKMRLLWSLLRMWMEWTYAWNRWDEYHRK